MVISEFVSYGEGELARVLGYGGFGGACPVTVVVGEWGEAVVGAVAVAVYVSQIHIETSGTVTHTCGNAVRGLVEGIAEVCARGVYLQFVIGSVILYTRGGEAVAGTYAELWGDTEFTADAQCVGAAEVGVAVLIFQNYGK